MKPHAIFNRDGSDLILQLPVTFSQIALGTTIEVPTLEGRRPLEIPSGTQSGTVFRLRGLGVPDPHSRARGDLLVQTFIEVPKKLGKRQQELLRELAELEHEHVTAERKSFLDRIKAYFVKQEDQAGTLDSKEPTK